MMSTFGLGYGYCDTMISGDPITSKANRFSNFNEVLTRGEKVLLTLGNDNGSCPSAACRDSRDVFKLLGQHSDVSDV